MHNVIIDHRRKTFVDQFSSASLPFRVHICSLADGSVIRDMYVNADPRLQRLQLNPPGIRTRTHLWCITCSVCTCTLVLGGSILFPFSRGICALFKAVSGTETPWFHSLDRVGAPQSFSLQSRSTAR